MQLQRPEPGDPSDGQWELALELGDDWYPLPLDRDALSFADEVTEVLLEEAPLILGHQIERTRAEAVAAEFRTMTEHAQQTGAFGASLFRPFFDGPTVGLTEQHVFTLDPPMGLRPWVERELERDVLDRPLKRTVDDVTLMGTPAVRVHEVSGLQPGEDESVIVESVVFFVLAPGGEIVVRQTFAWTTIDNGDLVALADRIAATLRFV